MKSVRIFCLTMLAPLALLSFPGTTATNLPAPSLPASGAYSEAFEQCLRDAMKGVTSDRAANEAKRNCRKQITGDWVKDADLPIGALDKLVIHAGFGWGIFSGSLYNGNGDYVLTQITVVLTPMKKSNAANVPTEGREYNIALAVQPLAKAALSLPIPSDNTLEYSWKITRARGFKTR
jgi:hypothetical protein